MLKKFVALSVSLACCAAAMAANSFDPATNTLSLDSVVVGNQTFSNVVVRIDSYAIKSVGSSAPSAAVASTCSAANFSLSAYNAIAAGQSVTQVNQIMGCQYTPALTIAVGNEVGHSSALRRRSRATSCLGSTSLASSLEYTL